MSAERTDAERQARDRGQPNEQQKHGNQEREGIWEVALGVDIALARHFGALAPQTAHELNMINDTYTQHPYAEIDERRAEIPRCVRPAMNDVPLLQELEE